ncbi:MAG: DUF3971 domain-containing protein [Alphaproteobacteria bacterium]|nr:DUF3971 domain-containing protein [Alphaproteobacteria bacterium]
MQVAIVCSMLAVGLVFWRLYAEPVPVDFLLPKIAARVLPAHWKAAGQSITLQARMRQTGFLHVSIKDLDITKQDGTPFVRLPEVDISYGLWNLIMRDYIPQTVLINRAVLYLTIDEEGKILLSQAENGGAKNKTPLSAKNLMYYLSLFGRLELADARVQIADIQRGEKLSVPRLNFLQTAERNMTNAMTLNATIQTQDRLVDVVAESELDRLAKRLTFGLALNNLDISRLGRVIDVIDKAQLPVEAKAQGVLDFNQAPDFRSAVRELYFQIKNTAGGTIDLPAPLTNTYNVKSATINGSFAPNLAAMRIAKSSVRLKEGPVASLDVEITGLDAFFKTKDEKNIRTTLESTIKDIPTELVPRMWPAALGPDAHAWVEARLSQGRLPAAQFALSFVGGELAEVAGNIQAQGVRVDYLPPMQPLTDVDAQVLLTLDTMKILADTGVLGNVRLKNAALHFTDLQADIARADMRIAAEGPVREVMQLIASEPLAFPQMFGFDPGKTGGNAAVQTTLKFPLIDALTADQVQASVSARIADGVFDTPLDVPLTDGRIDLTADNRRLVLTGTGRIRDVPIQVEWTELFRPSRKQSPASYDIRWTATEDQIKSFFADAPLYMQGKMSGRAALTRSKAGAFKGTITADFAKANVDLYPLSVTKEPGQPLQWTGEVSISKNNVFGPVDFKTTGVVASAAGQGPLSIVGRAAWAPALDVSLTEVKAPGNALAGSLTLDKRRNLTLRLTGDAWNLQNWWMVAAQKEKDKPAQPAAPTLFNSIDAQVSLNKLTLAADKPLQNLRVSALRRNQIWQKINLSVRTEKRNTIVFDPETQLLDVHVRDLGDLLERMNATRRFAGGDMTIRAQQMPTGGFDGTLSMKNFKMKEPGFFLQAVSVLGIIDGLLGKNLVFTKTYVPFKLLPDRTVHIANGYSYGTSLGFTMNGLASLEYVDLTGSVIPAYAVNSLPGRIPLIGGLFKGGEGGGLVGVKFDMKGSLEKPDIKFNPLSSIAPGILGTLFQ